MQRKQLIVKLPDEVKGNRFIKYLERNGFENVHELTYEKLRIKVLVIGDNEFFATNATCLAGLAQANLRPISIEDFIALYNAQEELTLC